MNSTRLVTPLVEKDIRQLAVGDEVWLNGDIYTSRDMAHLRYRELLENGQPLPHLLSGAAIFHAGPVVRKNKTGNWLLEVIGPTTSIRMEPYADLVGQLGVRILIGKGGMAKESLRAMEKYGYVYLQAAPGCAAYLAQGVEDIVDVCWLEMGMPEALWHLWVKNFGPFIVGMDTKGNSLYRTVQEKALEKLEKIYPEK
jgi:fumarate hydratase subunit beta/L(+)-tartrate dehydratase beta subunit